MNDDRPVGGGMGSKGFSPPRADPADDFSKLSINQLLTNANWKARKEGYDKIAHDPKKHRTTFFDRMAKAAAESNAAAQESLLEALAALVPVCDGDERGLLCQAPLQLAIEKGITGRPKAVATAQQFASALVEYGNPEEVCEALLPAFTHKTPKNRQVAAQLCTKLIGEFGVQHFPMKPILKAMQPLFNDANPQVRKEAASLCSQCYQYLGASIKGFLTDLRDVQLQELEKQFESATLGAKPTKKIRGRDDVAPRDSRKNSTKPIAIASLTGNGATGDVDDTAFALLDESVVIPKLPKKFFPQALDRQTSWQDRCEYVTNTLLPLLAAPRLRSSDDYHELASMMKVYLTDPQAPLMLFGFQMIQACARGLRGNFANCAKIYIAPLFDKMKDKKTSVLLHISATLEALLNYHCITMDQCSEEIEAVSQSKNPSQRLALVTFCTRTVEQLDVSQYQRLSRAVGMLRRMVNDEKTENRDAAYILLARLCGTSGEAPYRAVFAAMDDKQKARMQVVLASPRNQPAPSASSSAMPTPMATGATPSESPAKKYPRVEDLSARSGTGASGGPPTAARRLQSSNGPRATPTLTTAATPGSSSAPTPTGGSARPSYAPPPPAPSGRPTASGHGRSSMAAPSPSLDDPISLESSLPPRMDAGNLMLGVLGGDANLTDLLRSRDWSQRLDGMARVKRCTDEWTAGESARYFNALVVHLRTYPSFRESTFQVFQAELNVLSDVLAKATAITPGAGYAIVAGYTPRLTEPKNRQPIRDLCTAIGQRHGYRFVMHHMMLVAKEVKTPRLMQECNEYFTDLVDRCTEAKAAREGNANEETEGSSAAAAATGRLDVRGMIDYVRRPCFEQTAPPARAATMQLLLALGRYDPAAVRHHVQSLSPQVVAQFEQASAGGSGSGAAPSTAGNGRGSVAQQHPPPRGRPSGVAGAPPQAPRPSLVAPRPSSGSNTNSNSCRGGGNGNEEEDGASPPPKRHRASSQSPSVGTRASVGGGAAGPAAQPRRSSSARPSALHASTMARAAANNNSIDPVSAATPQTAAEPSSALRPILRAIAGSADWRDRLDAVHAADDYIDSSGGALPPSAVAPLLKVLGSRFGEANKNFVVDVLRTILRTVEAGGPEESREPLRRLMPGALSMLGDQKTMLRDGARRVVFIGMEVCGLDMLLQPLQRPLGSESNTTRQNTLEAMVYGFEQAKPTDPPVSRAGLQLLMPSIVKALMDRIYEVRVAAEGVIGHCLPLMGEEPVMRCVTLLKPAEQQAVMPAIERQLGLHDGGNGNEEGAGEGSGHRTPRTPRGGSVSHTPASTPRRGPATPRRRFATPPAAETPTRRRSQTPSFVPAPAPAAAAVAGRAPAPSRTTGGGRASLPPRLPSEDPHAHPSPPLPTPARTAAPATVPASEPPPPQPQPQHRQSVSKERAEPPKAAEELSYSIPEIQVGLCSATPNVAYAMCGDFMKYLGSGEDCGTSDMLLVIVERLGENTHKLETRLASALITCLAALFRNKRCAARCTSNLIFRMVGTMFDCLLSEQFSLNETVLKSLNGMTLKLLEGCPANEAFSGLMSRMTSYSTMYLQSGRKGDLKYIQVTVKCLMRLDLELVSAETVVLCCHEYLLQHPPSSFKSLDDLPIRTVKTILQTVTRRQGSALLALAERLVGPNNLVTHFICACLEAKADGAAAATAAPRPTTAVTPPPRRPVAVTPQSQREDNERSVVEESMQQQRASQSPAPRPGTPRRASGVPAAASIHHQPHQQHADPSSTPQALLQAATPTDKRRITSTPAAPKTAPTPATVTTAPAPTPAGDQTLGDIFTRIRHHTSSQQGIDELYDYIKAHGCRCDDDFNHQFLRCSEAFRLYIKRKLDRKISDDAAVPPGFVLPEALTKLPHS